MNSLIDADTWSDCQEILSTSMPTGRSASSSSMRTSIARPTSTTLTPERLEIAIPIAGRPFDRMIAAGGSRYPRRISAMSPSRMSR